MISFYHTGFIICLIAAITLLVISVILFFVFDIRNVWLVRSGKAARKSIQEMSEASAKSGAFRAGGYQPRTKTSNLRQRKDNTGDIASGSGPTGENNHDALGYPLYNSAQTIGLNLQDTHSGLATAQYTYNSYYKGTQTETAKINDNVNADSGEITTTIDNGISGFSFEKEANQGSNLYTSGSGSKTISEDANSITLGLNLTDRVGLGTAAENKTFSIDTVAPVITVTWDNNDVRNGKYYNADRTATVTVKERNFNPDACNFITTGPTPSISGWTHADTDPRHGVFQRDRQFRTGRQRAFLYGYGDFRYSVRRSRRDLDDAQEPVRPGDGRGKRESQGRGLYEIY